MEAARRMTVHDLCPGCSHTMGRHFASTDAIHCSACGAICGERSADYRGTEEHRARRHRAECRGGPADGYQFTFEGPPPATFYVPREQPTPEPYDEILPSSARAFYDNLVGLRDDLSGPPEPWCYRPLVTNAGYARNAEWRFIYTFAH